MSIYHRGSGITEETDDTHDAEWWRRKENQQLLNRVRSRYRQYRKDTHGEYKDWLRIWGSSSWLRGDFNLESIPSEEVWKDLNSRKRGRE